MTADVILADGRTVEGVDTVDIKPRLPRQLAAAAA